jgi:hypothetical protein
VTRKGDSKWKKAKKAFATNRSTISSIINCEYPTGGKQSYGKGREITSKITKNEEAMYSPRASGKFFGKKK